MLIMQRLCSLNVNLELKWGVEGQSTRLEIRCDLPYWREINKIDGCSKTIQAASSRSFLAGDVDLKSK